ncbi:MAG: UDP-N-acetylmuramoyl-L-alanyl-D-glutamate--2,6-diaminopimelate ligase [Candidatus Parabeggiatoa sp.]|nr:UDP-N-acetylmuramoyl-L-alanyl-D-glutamate--2,6-diaminopimelate ligase [Candidatus Parabeggiatoa sp.]
MLLSELLNLTLPTASNPQIKGLALDSRKVLPGDLFFACQGTQIHGEKYIDAALKKGAIAVLKEAPTTHFEMLAGKIPCFAQPTLSQQVGNIAARFYGYPSHHQRVIGVTGTNGKTSVTYAIAHLLHTENKPCGLLGTLGYGIYGQLQPASHTTPDAIQLQALLAQFSTQQVDNVVMEVSSHALAQDRVQGIQFETAVLTNLSRDHLDYHHTMTQYGDAKRRLFTWPHLKTAIINQEDTFGQRLIKTLPETVTPLTYSLSDKTADVYAQIQAYHTHGCSLKIQSRWGEGYTDSPWFGEFNVSNLLAALAVLLNMGLPLSQLLSQVNSLPTVPGRMERLGQPDQPTVLIDYAHTPDALEKVLLTLRQHLKATGKRFNEKGDKNHTFSPLLWCVFGCGGDRDRGKRRLMGEVAQHHADKIIITDDNPRHEASQMIIDDILEGCPAPTTVIPEREDAIRHALQHASVNDIVLIAGKGHEDYQEIGDQRFPFSDRALALRLVGNHKGFSPTSNN